MKGSSPGVGSTLTRDLEILSSEPLLGVLQGSSTMSLVMVGSHIVSLRVQIGRNLLISFDESSAFK